MSFINFALYMYKAGLIHPSEPLPAAMRAALMFEKNPAATGADAEVPETMYQFPPIRSENLLPANEISGNPLPTAL